jgi:predicted dehydrogenase
MKQPLRIGLLGAARIAPQALLKPAAANKAVVVAAVAARDQQRAHSLADRYGITRVHRTYTDLVADPALDAVYIPLPNSLHGTWTRQALEAGKHVLCEKPLAANAEEAARLATLAAARGLVLMEAFHTLYHPLAARMKRIVQSGALGRIQRVEAHFCTLLYRRNDIRWNYALGGGAMMDLGCYTVRLLRYLLDAEPIVERATATCATPQVDRKMIVDLRFPGADGSMIAGKMSCAFWSRRLIRITARIVGNRGELFVINPLLPHLFHLLSVKQDGRRRFERCTGASTYTYQLQAFVDAITNQTAPLSNGWDGVANMRVIDAAYAAAGLPLRQPFA